MTDYGKLEYWEDRYIKDKDQFDWYQRYAALRETLVENIPYSSNILNVGAGNSRLSEEMFEDGYSRIVNIDTSFTVIKTMNELYR